MSKVFCVCIWNTGKAQT